jgi:hypothetical protein
LIRAALYWVPALDDPLFAAGTAWLGRDPETGASVPQPDIPGLPELTRDARRYGLHATLRPPMRLATGWEEFAEAAHAIAASGAPFPLPALELQDVGGFLALREATPCQALQRLADRCILGTERHRLRPGAEELARRRAAGLTPRQDALLEQYGYPYVLDEWFFHITLTCRLDAAEKARIWPRAAAHFAPVLRLPRRVEDVCICTEGPGEFLVAERIKLGRVPLPPTRHLD